MTANKIPSVISPELSHQTAQEDRSSATPSLRIHRLTVNHLENSVGVHPNNVNIRWAINGCGTQTAFQIVLTDASGNRFDSGKISSPIQSYQVPVGVLNGCQVYDLDLSMWTKAGDVLNEVLLSLLHNK